MKDSRKVGRSGEYLAASVLSLVADTVVIVPHDSNSDIIFEYKNKIYRCQVKTQSKIEKHRTSWRFDLRKGPKVKSRGYKKNNLDVFALVSIKYKTVMFVSNLGKKLITVQDKVMRETNSLKSFKNLLKEI